MKALLIFLVLTGPALAADGDSCTYGGALGVMQQGRCQVTPGGVITTPAARATCGPGKSMVVRGRSSFECLPDQK